jgi:hypothetical protein
MNVQLAARRCAPVAVWVGANAMDAKYAATYWDKNGKELTSICNNAKVLSMVVRGIEFRGSDFDALEPTGNYHAAQLSSFTLQQGSLCSCVIEADMPIPVAVQHHTVDGVLRVHLELGNPTPNGGIDREHLELRLKVGDSVFKSKGWSGWFEDELLDIQKQMPDDNYIKACINCAFSDYSPLGHGLFGCLACFRDNKQGYLLVRSKHDLFNIWKSMTEFVQETYLCPEFERRVAGTGYRG